LDTPAKQTQSPRALDVSCISVSEHRNLGLSKNIEQIKKNIQIKENTSWIQEEYK